MKPVSAELSHAMALALESSEVDVENALQLLGRALRRIENVRSALGGPIDVAARRDAS
jgi:hypothetical protein